MAEPQPEIRCIPCRQISVVARILPPVCVLDHYSREPQWTLVFVISRLRGPQASVAHRLRAAAKFRPDEIVGRYKNSADKFRVRLGKKNDASRTKSLFAQRLESGENRPPTTTTCGRAAFAGRASEFAPRDCVIRRFLNSIASYMVFHSQAAVLDPGRPKKLVLEPSAIIRWRMRVREHGDRSVGDRDDRRSRFIVSICR